MILFVLLTTTINGCELTLLVDGSDFDRPNIYNTLLFSPPDNIGMIQR